MFKETCCGNKTTNLIKIAASSTSADRDDQGFAIMRIQFESWEIYDEIGQGKAVNDDTDQWRTKWR